MAKDTVEVTAEVTVKVSDALASLNEQLGSVGQPYKLALVDPAELAPLEKNAHYMTHEVFQSLVRNVARDQALSSIPFCWKDPEDGRYHVLSGNHRVKAAVAASVNRVLILYDDRPLTRQERVAVQLSHNALVGKDDPALLRDLFDEIADLSLKQYAGLDDKELGRLAAASVKSLAESRLDYRVVTFLFLPEEADRLKDAFAKAAGAVAAEESHLLSLRQFDAVIDTLDKTKAAWHTFNSAVAMGIVLDMFDRHQEELAEGWLGVDSETGTPAAKHKGLVPLASVFGTGKVPARVAVMLRQCRDKIASQGNDSVREPLATLEEIATTFLRQSN